MRFPTFLVVLCLAAASFGQGPQGSYTPANNPPVQWRINENHTLMWGSKPFIPVGLRIDGSPEAIGAAKARGIKDVLVGLPANGMGWKEAVSALELNGMRYMISLESLATGATGYMIEPQSYRVTGITSKRTVELTIPGATSAFAVLALKRDSSITKTQRVKIENGKFRMEVESPNQLEHILLIYPETTGISTLDSWEGLDDHRDSLLRSFRTTPFGVGMRGVLNPLGAMIQQPTERQFVPNAPRFQAEFAGYLEQKYRNVESVKRAWSMSANEAATFADLARLSPLWSGTRGVQFVWDPKNDHLTQVESKRSLIWTDIRNVISASESKRFQRLVSAIRKACDVPVIQEWVGWNSYYEQPNPSLDGLACQTSGTTFTSLVETAGRAASSLFRWTRPGISVASAIDLRGEASTVPISGIADDLISCGIRGLYFRTEDPAHLAAIVQEATKRADDVSIANLETRAIYFPENALNPANIQRLPGGRWWLPSPDSGNRIDMGSLFTGYRLSGVRGSTFVIWSNAGLQRVRLRLVDPSKIEFIAVDGSNPDPKITKGKLDVNIGPSPLIIQGTDEIPIPQASIDEVMFRFSALEKEADKFRIDISQEAFAYRDAFISLDRNPGGSFVAMMSALNRMNARLARYMWIEAETSKDTTFSEILAVQGASGAAVLNLRSPFEGATNDYYAEYGFTARSSEELEVWIAARIPKESRNDVNLMVGSQLLKISTEPVSHYGAGYGWYKLGTTRLGGVQSVVQLRVFPQAGAELAIDAILFYPGQFTPKGVKQPDAINFATYVPDK